MSSVQQLRRLVAAFDHGGARVQHAFAYGSAVFKQASGSSSSSSTTTTATKDSPQVDLVLAVGDSDIRSWHAANLSHPRHRLHYSGTARHILGPGGIAFLQDRSGGGRVYYNPFAQIDEDGPRVKYGVTSVSALAADLREWQSMYLAGRMHKPVLILRSEADSADSTDSVDSASSIDSAQQANLQCALATALLGLPASFTERELYIAIAGLSYLGDFRMLVGGESPSKVADIVDGPGQLERFRELYRDALGTARSLNVLSVSSQAIEQDVSPAAQRQLLTSMLNRRMQSLMLRRVPALSEQSTVAVSSSAPRAATQSDVQFAIRRIAAFPAIIQALKGIISAGILPSISYALRKLRKGILKF